MSGRVLDIEPDRKVPLRNRVFRRGEGSMDD